MSRQRLRPSLSEITGDPCPHCDGTGFMQSTDWMALQVMRAIEDEATRQNATQIELKVSSEVALYLLNQKRQSLSNLEERNNLRVIVRTNGENRGGTWEIEVLERSDNGDKNPAVSSRPANDKEKAEDVGKPRSRNRRRVHSNDAKVSTELKKETTEIAASSDEENVDKSEEQQEEGEQIKRRRRRGRRGGRRRNRSAEEQAEFAEASATDKNVEQKLDNKDDPTAPTNTEAANGTNTASEAVETTSEDIQPDADTPKPEDKPKPRRARRPRRRKAADEEVENPTTTATTSKETLVKSESTPENTGEVAPAIEAETDIKIIAEETSTKAVATEASVVQKTKPEPANESENISNQPPEATTEIEAEATPPSPPRRGWWQRVIS
jgi:ribonuclease E